MLKLINPKNDRHKSNAKAFLNSACNVVDNLGGYGMAGYVVAAWDGAGNTSIRYKSGGIVSRDVLPAHVFSQLTQINAALDKERSHEN